MVELMNRFYCDEDGAVTVDWVVLSASLVGLALATVATVRAGIFSASANMASDMANIDLGTTP
jgi:Flp pilus assembly pilin Flp